MSAALRSFFGQFRIPAEVYRDKITDDLSPDPNNWALAGVEAMSADQYLCRLSQRHPKAVFPPNLSDAIVTLKKKNRGVFCRAEHKDRPNKWRCVHKDGGIFV